MTLINIDPEVLDGAGFVAWDDDLQLLAVWNGEHTVNIYDARGLNVDVFTFGFSTKAHGASPTKTAARDHIASYFANTREEAYSEGSYR